MPINRIHTLADGRRSYKITDSAGKRHTLRSRKGETLAQFRARCDVLDRMTTTGSVDVSITLDELWDQYETQYQQVYTGKADNRVMRPIYSKHVQPVFGHRRVTDITRGQIHQHLTALVAQGYSPSMVSKVRLCFSRPYTWAIDAHGLQIANPTQGLRVKHKRAVGDPDALRVISDEDLIRFHALASTTKYANYYRLLELTGLRPSEGLGLQWQDITLKDINVQRRVSSDGLGELKTASSHRQIPITSELRQVLSDQRRQAHDHTGWLFAAQAGMPSMSAVKNSLRKILAKSAVWEERSGKQVMVMSALQLSLYDFRHTFATRAADSGMPMHLLQRLLGHSDVQTTMRYYVHLTAEGKDQIAEHMERMSSDPVKDASPNVPDLSPIDRQADADSSTG